MSACGLDRFEPSEEVCEDADCGTCPACLTARKDAELAALRAEVVSLRQQLNKRTADDTVDLTAPDYPAEKKHKAGEQQHEDNNEKDDDDEEGGEEEEDECQEEEESELEEEAAPTSTWVLAQGDYPDSSCSDAIRVEVIGVYACRQKAEIAKAEYLEEHGYESGRYGFHLGEDSESTIDIFLANSWA
jgi:hypothetical protein